MWNPANSAIQKVEDGLLLKLSPKNEQPLNLLFPHKLAEEFRDELNKLYPKTTEEPYVIGVIEAE